MTSKRVAILGGGAGGRTAAVEIGLRGHHVVLADHPDFASGLAGIREEGKLHAEGAVSGTVAVEVAPDVASAVVGADICLIVVPTVHQRLFADLVAPAVEEGMTFALMPGSLGSLDFHSRLRQLGVDVDLNLAEIAALPYATRITGPTTLKVFGRRKYVQAGVFPADRSGQLEPLLADIYPGIKILGNVLEAGLNNPNPTLHCLGVLLSASRIEYSHGEFYYYEEGMTPHVCRAIEAIDAERIAIGRAFGCDILSLKDTYPTMGYGPRGDSFWSVIRGVAALNGIKGPSEIDSRYLTEDVPIGLTIYSELAAVAGVPTPLMTSVVAIAGALLDTDWQPQARTLARCGIDGLDTQQVLQYVGSGVR
ncbi:MAG: NAD/NADP octopine/nopaline dehydrogenase family protein [Actinobacteria bacterium]|nr:NAD/NADP octopine/nopaline dehydrogenase family protein [Actinomycetota bacterium]